MPTPLHAPTERPAEPVMAGTPGSPTGLNPLAAPQPGAENGQISSILEQVANLTGSQALQALAEKAKGLGQ
jgi:hypothetical protein